MGRYIIGILYKNGILAQQYVIIGRVGKWGIATIYGNELILRTLLHTMMMTTTSVVVGMNYCWWLTNKVNVRINIIIIITSIKIITMIILTITSRSNLVRSFSSGDVIVWSTPGASRHCKERLFFAGGHFRTLFLWALTVTVDSKGMLGTQMTSIWDGLPSSIRCNPREKGFPPFQLCIGLFQGKFGMNMPKSPVVFTRASPNPSWNWPRHGDSTWWLAQKIGPEKGQPWGAMDLQQHLWFSGIQQTYLDPKHPFWEVDHFHFELFNTWFLLVM